MERGKYNINFLNVPKADSGNCGAMHLTFVMDKLTQV